MIKWRVGMMVTSMLPELWLDPRPNAVFTAFPKDPTYLLEGELAMIIGVYGRAANVVCVVCPQGMGWVPTGHIRPVNVID